MQPRGIALVTLYRVNIGVEDIGTLQELTGIGRRTLHQIVIVRVHAGNHVLAYAMEHTGDGRLLAPVQVALPSGQHNLEIAGIVLKPAQDHPPEEHVFIALHVGHYLATRLLGGQMVRRLYVLGVDMFCKSPRHLPPCGYSSWVMSVTSVTWSLQPFITTAGLWVVMIICTLGLSRNTRLISCFCHSKCKLISGSSIKST